MYGSSQELQAIADQSSQMRNAFTQKYGNVPQHVVAPVTQAPVTQAPVTQAPVTQAPVTQAPVTQAPVTQAPVPTSTTQSAAAPQQQFTNPDLAAANEEGKALRASFAQRYPAQTATPVKGGTKYDESDKQSMAGSLLLGGHIGLYELAARMVQGGAKLGEITKFMPKGTAAEFTRQFNQKYLKNPAYLRSIKQHPYATKVGEIAGETAPLLPAAYLAPAAAEVVGMGGLASGVVGAGVGGAAMGLSQYDPTGKESAQQAGIGAAANIVLPYVGGKIVKGLGRLVSPEVIATAKRFGIKLATYPGAERAISKVPGTGVKKIIAERGAKVSQAGQAIAKKIIDEAGGKAKVAENGVEKGYARHFTDALKRSYYASKASVEGLKKYLMDESDKITEKTGAMVNPLSMKMAASNELAAQQSLPTAFQDKSLIGELTKHQDAQPMTYRSADALKKQIDDKISSMGTPVTGVQKNLRRTYISMRSGLADDINNFADNAGTKFRTVHDTANKLYANKVAPFDKAPYSKMLTGDMNSGQFISRFIKPAKEVTGGEEPEDVNKLLGLMPKTNQRAKLAMRAAVMSRALEHADLPGGGINGKKFADEAMKLSKASGGVFSKAQKDTIKGYQLLTHHIEKYAPKATDISKLQGSSMPRNMLHMGGLGLAFWHPYIIGAIYASGMAVSKLFTTTTGQRLLRGVASLDAKAGSATLNPLVTRGLKLILSTATVKAGRG